MAVAVLQENPEEVKNKKGDREKDRKSLMESQASISGLVVAVKASWLGGALMSNDDVEHILKWLLWNVRIFIIY